MRLGERAEHCRDSIKAFREEVLELANEYTKNGASRHVAPMRAAHGYLVDAARALQQGIEQGGKDLANELEKTLALPKADPPDEAQS